MKPCTIGSRLVLGLATFAGLAQSFPTAENLAKLARDDGLTPDQLHEKLLYIKEKRLSFDPLGTPIQGELLNLQLLLQGFHPVYLDRRDFSYESISILIIMLGLCSRRRS